MIFFGLGNNDSQYFNTRHNVGRLVVECLANNEIFKKKKSFAYTKSQGHYFTTSLGYMNNSGVPLQEFIHFFKLVDQVVVVQDDSDITEGDTKVVFGGGSGGHKGVESIYTVLGHREIWRVKIGVRPQGNRQRSETFVLSPISSNLERYLQTLSSQLKKILGRNDMNVIQQHINSL